MIDKIEQYAMANPNINKWLNADGSVTNLDGSIIFLPADSKRAKQYELANANVNKWLNADGTEEEMSSGSGTGTIGKTYTIDEVTNGNVTLLENGSSVATVQLDDDYVGIAVFNALETRVATEEGKSSDVAFDSINNEYVFYNKNGTEVIRWSNTTLFNFAGTFTSVGDLPTTGTIGDVAYVTDTTALYYWNGTGWSKINLSVDLSNYYTKSQIDGFLATKLNITDYNIDKTQIQTELSTKISNTQFNTSQALQNTKINKNESDITTLEKKHTTTGTSGVDKVITFDNGNTQDSTYDKDTIDSKIASGGTFDPTNYYTKTDIDNKFSDYYTKTDIDTGLATINAKFNNYYLKTEVDALFTTREKNHSKNVINGTITLTDGLDNNDDIYSKVKIDNLNNALDVKNIEQDERLTALENNPSTGLPNYAGIYLDGIVRVPPLLSATPIGAKFVDSDNDYFTSSTNVSDVSDFIFKETGIYKIDITVNGSATNNNANLTAVYWKNGTPIIGQNYNTNTGNFNVTYQFIINVTNVTDIYQFGAFDDGVGTITLDSFFSLTAKQSEALKSYVTLSQFNASQTIQNTRISSNETNISDNTTNIATNTANITLNSTNIGLLDGRVGTNETNVADLQSRLIIEEAKSSDVQSSDNLTFTFFDKNGNAKQSWTIADTSVFHYVGEYATIGDLPTTGTAGDIAKVTADSKYYLFDGTNWNVIEINLDLSNYYTKAEIDNFNTNFENMLDNQQTLLTKVIADVLLLDGATILINQKLANLEQNLTTAIGNIAVLDYAIVQLNNKVDNQIIRIDDNENNITTLQAKDIDLQSQIDSINASRVFDYVVPTFTDLPTTAVDNDLALVLSDNNYSDLPTYYKWVTSAWVYQANYNKDYYTKSEMDSQQQVQNTNIQSNTTALGTKVNNTLDNVDVGTATAGQVVTVKEDVTGVEFKTPVTGTPKVITANSSSQYNTTLSLGDEVFNSSSVITNGTYITFNEKGIYKVDIIGLLFDISTLTEGESYRIRFDRVPGSVGTTSIYQNEFQLSRTCLYGVINVDDTFTLPFATRLLVTTNGTSIPEGVCKNVIVEKIG